MSISNYYTLDVFFRFICRDIQILISVCADFDISTKNCDTFKFFNFLSFLGLRRRRVRASGPDLHFFLSSA